MAKALKDIHRFMRFDLDGWLFDKTLTYVGAEVWYDENKEPCGVKVHVMVTQDETEYPFGDVTNLGAQLTIKVRDETPEKYDELVPFQTAVMVVDVEKAVPWRAGEYAAQDISIIAKVQPVRTARAAASKGDE